MAVAINKLDDLIGKEVWFWTTRSNLNKGIIVERKGMGHARIRISCSANFPEGVCIVHADNIYLDKLDLIRRNLKEINGFKKMYANDIRSVEELVKFCYRHIGYSVDNANEQVAIEQEVREKSMELLGIEVDPDRANSEKGR